MAEIEEAIRRITSHSGVSGVLVLNQDGIPIKAWKIDSEKAVHYAAVFSPLIPKAQQLLSSCDSSSSSVSELSLIRLRTEKNEIIIAPDVQTGYVMLVIQDTEVLS
ncbi:hypothetical protein RCL1_006579 [Eukaryota sp. TZLM3-RCL]